MPLFARGSQNPLAYVPVLFFNKSMQTALAFGQATDLLFLRDRLRGRFGPVFDARRHDPISQLAKAIISGRTYDTVSSAAFERLVLRYPNVDDLADAPVKDIEGVIADVTFAADKAVHLRAALRMIRAQAGQIALDFLSDWPIGLALRWLEALPGVGPKAAAAVLNFSSLRKRIFVVDTHVLRVLQRFGFVGPHAESEDAGDAIMAAADGFDTDDVYELHWLVKDLGQQICTHGNPRCGECPLAARCLKRVWPGKSVRRSAVNVAQTEVSV